MRGPALLAATAVLLSSSFTLAQPVDSGLEERVEVQYVLVDVIVHDRHGRPIPGLTKSDFDLTIGGDVVEIATLDGDCEVRAAGDPEPMAADRPRVPGDSDSDPARIVLAFDYFHMENAAEAIDAALGALDRWAQPGYEHMVLSIGQVPRVELGFTSDLDAVRGTLKRMRDDPGLYFGNTSSFTDWPFFERFGVVYDAMERIPGRKTLVLFSGPFASDGWHHDLDFKELAALAAVARTPIYPVDAGGMRTLLDPLGSPLGGPPRLRRFATETGGRMTADTNDIGLAYERASTDLRCVYTLGFYDKRPRLDRYRRMVINVPSRFGSRVYHPAAYVARSPEARRLSLAETAAVVPELFDGSELVAELCLETQRESERWEATVEVSLDSIPPGWERAAHWDLELVVRRPTGAVLRRIERRVPASADGFRWSEEITLRPGELTLAAVLSAPGAPEPIATVREVSVPAAAPRAPRSNGI